MKRSGGRDKTIRRMVHIVCDILSTMQSWIIAWFLWDV